MLALNQTVYNKIPSVVLIPILAILGTSRTLGETINFVGVVLNTGVPTIAISVLWNLIVPRNDAAFWLGLFFLGIPLHLVSSPPGKRLALALLAIFMWTWWRGLPHPGHFEGRFKPYYYPSYFFGTIGCAVGVALVSVCLPYPRTAKRKALKVEKDMRRLAAVVFKDIVCTVSSKREAGQDFLDSQVHLHRLAALMPVLKQAVDEAEVEEVVKRYIVTVLCVITVVPAVCGWHKEVLSQKPLKKLHKTVVLMHEIIPLLSALSNAVDNMEDANAKTNAFHLDTMKYIRKQLAQLSNLGGMIMITPDDEELYPQLSEELTNLGNHLLKWRVNEFYKGNRPMLPEKGTHLKSFLFSVRRFCKVLIEVHGCTLADTEAPTTLEVLISPAIHYFGHIQLACVKLKGTTKADCIETLKTIIPYVGSLGVAIVGGMNPAYWAPVTVALICSSSAAGSLNTAVNRIQGTIFGSTYGYIVLRTFHNPPSYVYGIAFSLWCVVAGYVRSSPKYGYGGLVAALTAALIIFGYNPATGGSKLGHSSVDEEAFSRIQQTLTACVLYMASNVLIAPTDPADDLKTNLQRVLLTAKDITSKVLHGYIHSEFELDLRPDVHNIGDSCKLQGMLLGEVEVVPVLWRGAFPVEEYRAVLGDQWKLHASLRELCTSFHDMSVHHDDSVYKHLRETHTPTLETINKKLSLYLKHISYPTIYPPPSVASLYHSLRTLSDLLVSSFHSTLITLKDLRARPSQILSTDFIESVHCFIQAIYSIIHTTCRMSKNLRSFRLTEHSLSKAEY
eukprot:TRINITY_DN5336_c0_g1_i1.p1 TRINITY_DN5336_c0_g1~~TRINITY_DN5336_c0_g1_i1.p1  ORF type:complete len:787 (+),score=135.10 TRINITY_DN5336_c0_g1_i1:461-2821(+)